MLKHELFEREILLLESEDLRNFARWYIDNFVGDWFFKSGASSSGKYHPAFAQGESALRRAVGTSRAPGRAGRVCRNRGTAAAGGDVPGGADPDGDGCYQFSWIMA